MLKTIFASLKRIGKVCEKKNVICFVPRLQQSTIPELEDEPALGENLAHFRAKYPEFLPNPEIKLRNFIREKLERRDMLSRRKNLLIPEFYVGSIVAVTSSDVHSPGKTVRFLGICIHRRMEGLKSTFILRNVVEHQGVEVIYALYSPTIQKIEVIKLEKRLDNELFYLRDAPLEYSTFPMDMTPDFVDPNDDIPVNTLKVKLNPRPWLLRYERMNLKGVILPELPEKVKMKAEKHKKPWEKYDLMMTYRNTIPEEEQDEIFSSICDTLKQLETTQTYARKMKDTVKVKKQTLF